MDQSYHGPPNGRDADPTRLALGGPIKIEGHASQPMEVLGKPFWNPGPWRGGDLMSGLGLVTGDWASSLCVRDGM